MADDSLSIYDEIEIEDMTFDPAMQIYTFPCPCGDRFEIAIDDLRDGEEIAADLPKADDQQNSAVAVRA
ncbi:Diphthamide biosynthesis protein 3 [Penicillium capsulatum]|uniref:Diphthamide biosynthesis protein 3 n=1 Tax=Penicillium capsulatum TaxID=69766 RepID=A0A9W9IMU0_9EURO|nr:Diphthamide biosynthesis protein 3 [Penicillium capsulatum]